MTKAHVCEQLAQGCYLAVRWVRVEPATSQSPVRHATITPPSHKYYHLKDLVILQNTKYRNFED